MTHATRTRILTFCLAVLPAGIVFRFPLFSPLVGLAQTPSFSTHSFSSAAGNSVALHGDLNNDGYEDLIIGTVPSPYRVFLSKGNGTYTELKSLPASINAYNLLLGDFNGDGKLDLVAGNQIYFGHGDGTFGSGVVIPLPAGFLPLAVADVNHDGKTDLLWANGDAIQVFFGNGDGTFRAGPASPIENGQPPVQFITGDFNGDGNVDVVMTWFTPFGPLRTTVQAFSGDGNGNFTPTFSDNNQAQLNLSAADVNGDGISDLVGTSVLNDPDLGSFTSRELYIYYGQGNGGMVPTGGIVLAQFGVGQAAVADFNGDGIPDIAVFETDCDDSSDCTVTTAATLHVLSGMGNGAFADQTTVSSLQSNPGSPFVLRGNRDTKADLLFTNPTTSATAYITLLNTTAGNFPTCAAPNAAVGIAQCSPTAGSSVNSPVNFAIGAAGTVPLQKVEVWADGKKQVQQLAGAFSNYSFLNASVPLAAGSHKIVVFAAGWDNSLQSKSFTLDVKASSCAAPASAGVHICSPASGASVSSPVLVTATSKVTGTIVSTQLWVDGVKNFNAPGSTTLTTSVSLAAGSHRFAVIATNTSGQKWESTVTATVK
jgi:FG-GAP-like repeat